MTTLHFIKHQAALLAAFAPGMPRLACTGIRLKASATAVVAALLIGAGSANAGPIDLNTWTPAYYPAVSGFLPGNWVVAPGGASVTQQNNGQPTLFYSDFSAQGTTVSGKIQVNDYTGDDDFIGFVFGWNGGDEVNAVANYLLVDWKAGSQYYDFASPSSSPGGVAWRGLAVSQVFGVPDADEFWQHTNLDGTPATSGLTEIARGNTLGSTGWTLGTEYTFGFNFGPNNLQLFVNGVQELNIAGSFSNGSLGFYNFSQGSVKYSAFDVAPGPFTVPDTSSSLVLLSLGLVGMVAGRRLVGRGHNPRILE